ncbi:MAG: hypothetical protein HQL33_03075 [Alphaproteobacteria bacterium]|nr:hypothetical protein [Alphaproteobacteria bacterium]MBF0128956.1 hypothetical protein [Alphaproteobacteria bacterium]
MEDKVEILAAIAAFGDRVDRRFDAIDTRIRALETEVAELKGEARQMSVRISDVYTRLPVPIAYQPLDKQRA